MAETAAARAQCNPLLTVHEHGKAAIVAVLHAALVRNHGRVWHASPAPAITVTRPVDAVGAARAAWGGHRQ